jgi:riboflavin biosynthesis pyrimidine reductase
MSMRGLWENMVQGPSICPAFAPVDEPLLALSLLQQGGARAILLHGGRGLANRLADRHIIDELTMFLTAPTVSPAPLAAELLATSWAGFTIRSVRRLNAGVLVDAPANPVADDG